MNHRERQLAVLRRQPIDRPSVDAISIENLPELSAYLGIPADQVLNRLGIDGRVVTAGYCGEVPCDPAGIPLTEWGTPTTDDYGTAHHYPLSGLESRQWLNSYPWPQIDKYGWDALSGVVDAWDADYALRGPYWKPLFCQACELMGMEEAMMLMHTDPTLFEALVDRIFQNVTEYCQRFLEVVGDRVPIFYLGDDFATQRGLMISPEHWRRFFKPRFARLFEMGKQAGKFVWFHSCGDITDVLPDLIDIGVDVWETVQLQCLPFPPHQLKQKFGRHLTFFGGISTQRLPFMDVGEVPEAVKSCWRELGEEGYILGPDHHIKDDVSPEKVVTLFDTATGLVPAAVV